MASSEKKQFALADNSKRASSMQQVIRINSCQPFVKKRQMMYLRFTTYM